MTVPSAEARTGRTVVVGTAGHVDHGKSALVRALTGTDPDRLSEEKARGLTIDLGFAWAEMPGGGVVSFVDVPGHEDFVRNMLAGAGGIAAALLVVAADEGPMPQTTEHVAILDLLAVRHAVVAVTKADLVDDEWLALVREEVEAMLAATSLAGAEILAVSATRGDGLDDLRDALAELVRATPPPVDRSRPRLAVDRAFTLAGFGTVATGTLRDGTIQEGATLEVLPEGRRCRARSLQSHGRAVTAAPPGTRTAVNLGGVSTDEVRRGDVVAPPGIYQPTRLVDVRLRVLADAGAPLRHDARVAVFLGAAEVQAHVRVIGRREIAPGEESAAQLRLAAPIVPCASDRFVVRQPSPPRTIGGGIVLDTHPRSRWRRFRAATVQRFEALSSGRPEEIAWHALASREPCPAEALRAQQTGLEPDARDAALARLAEDGRALALGPLWMTDRGWQSLEDRLRRSLAAYHAQYPLRSGMPAEELRERLSLSPEAFGPVLSRAAAHGWLVREGSQVRGATHDVRYDEAQAARTADLLARFRASPYRPPSAKEAESAVGADVLASLVERGELVAVGGDVLFDRAAYDELRRAVAERLAADGRVTVADVRDAFDTSRRYALALLEHLDRLRVTRRVGDAHVAGAPGSTPP